MTIGDEKVVQRFEPRMVGFCDRPPEAGMYVSLHGHYVLHSAYAELAAELERLVADNETYQSNITAEATARIAAESQLAELRGILTAWHDEEVRDDPGNRRNAPGHAHEISGIWDSDNGAKAGKPCKRCALWFAVRDSRALAAADGATTGEMK